jgi:hypothetical protein
VHFFIRTHGLLFVCVCFLTLLFPVSIVAVQAAMSLATLHNFDREGVSAIAHADITLGQFISVNGTIKLHDFNRARFIAWNATSNAPCPYYIANNPGFMRSPEEYKYEPQTEKVRQKDRPLYVSYTITTA